MVLLRAHPRRFVLAFTVVLLLSLLAGPQLARADGPGSTTPGDTKTVIQAAPGTVGFDISWPQCGGPYPGSPTPFGIVGVNHGRAYTKNPCLRDQFRWAQAGQASPALYINLNSPGLLSFNAMSGPAGRCPMEDAGCLGYNYGYNTAAYSVSYARSQGVTPDAASWWLDIETMNTWSPDTGINAIVIQGAIDYFLRNHLPIGIYSTPYQWGEIAGGFAPGLPAWTAGAESLPEAQGRCNPGYAFGGGPVVMVQYVEQFDTNYRCP